MDFSIIAVLVATCAGMVLLPLGLKLLLKKLFCKDMTYFVSFLIVLATSMVLSGILSYINRSVR